MSAAEHPRLILAALLRGARERRNLTRNDVARRVGASIERIGDYEAGDVIPPSDVWRRYGASIDSSLHHRNREYQDAINSPRIEPATTATTATAAPPPAFNPPRVVTIAAPAVAESPARNVSHLRARQKEIAAAGYHFRRAEERDRRINEARRIVAERPGIALTELREILQSKFQGVALTHDVLRGLRDEAQAKVTRAIDRIATRTAREQSEQAPEVTSPQDSRHPCGCATGTHAWHGFCPFVAPELRAD